MGLEIHEEGLNEIEAHFRDTKNLAPEAQAGHRLVTEVLDPLRKTCLRIHKGFDSKCEECEKWSVNLTGALNLIDKQNDDIEDYQYKIAEAQRVIDQQRTEIRRLRVHLGEVEDDNLPPRAHLG